MTVEVDTFYAAGAAFTRSGTPVFSGSWTAWNAFTGGVQITAMKDLEGQAITTVTPSAADGGRRFYCVNYNGTVYLDDGTHPREPVEPAGMASLIALLGGVDLTTVTNLVTVAVQNAIDALPLGLPNGIATLDGAGILASAETPGTVETGVSTFNGLDGDVTSALAGVLPGVTSGAADGYAAIWSAANSRFQPGPVANAALPTFQVKGVPAIGNAARPGYKFGAATTIDAVDLQCGTPVRGGSLVVVLYKNGVVLSGGTLTVADGKLRATPGASLGWTFAKEDILTATVTNVGSTMAGGDDIFISFLSTGTFAAVASAPTAPSAVALTGSTGNYTVTITSGGGSPIGWHVIRDYDTVPVTAAVLPAGTLTYNDLTAGDHTYAVAAINASAASAQVAAVAASGVTYTGDLLIPTGTGVGGPTASPSWVGSQRLAGAVVANGARSDWTSDASSNGSKVYRTGGGDGMAASLTDCNVLLLFKFINTGAGFYLKTRNNGSGDTVRMRWHYNGNGNTFDFGYRRTGDGVTTPLATYDASAVTKNTTDTFAMLFRDGPSTTTYDWRFWNYTLSAAIPGAALTNCNGNANFAIGVIPAGYVGFEDGHGATSTTIEVISLKVSPFA